MQETLSNVYNGNNYDIYKINTKNMLLCYKKSINLCQHANRYEHVMVKTLSGTFNAISRGGGYVYNVMLHVNAATLTRLTSFILCLI